METYLTPLVDLSIETDGDLVDMHVSNDCARIRKLLNNIIVYRINSPTQVVHHYINTTLNIFLHLNQSNTQVTRI